MKCCLNCQNWFEIENPDSRREKFFCGKDCWNLVYQKRLLMPQEWAFLQFFVFKAGMAKSKLKEKAPYVPKPRGSSRPWGFNCFLDSTCGHCGKRHVRSLFIARPKRPSKHVLCWECSYRHRRACSYCKNEFSPVSLLGNSAVYCIPCRRELASITRKKGSITGLYPVSECRWCLKNFQPKSNRSQCCSHHCMLSFNEMVRRTGQEVRFSRLIECVCGKLISATNHKCPPCTFENKLQRRGVAQARRYEAMRLGDQGINWRSLGERDGWVCYLCNWVVQQKAGTAYEPLGGTVDHLIPLSKGGPHTWENVALAHRRCNTSRGNKDLELFDVES